MPNTITLTNEQRLILVAALDASGNYGLELEDGGLCDPQDIADLRCLIAKAALVNVEN